MEKLTKTPPFLKLEASSFVRLSCLCEQPAAEYEIQATSQNVYYGSHCPYKCAKGRRKIFTRFSSSMSGTRSNGDEIPKSTNTCDLGQQTPRTNKLGFWCRKINDREGNGGFIKTRPRLYDAVVSRV